MTLKLLFYKKLFTTTSYFLYNLWFILATFQVLSWWKAQFFNTNILIVLTLLIPISSN